MSLKEILRYGLSGEVNFEVSPILKVPGNHKLLLLIVVGVFGLLYSLLRYFTDVKKDSKEPPFIPQIIPYVGHLLGVLRYGPKYYDRISAKFPLPAYSLAMPGGGRIYVVNSPDLILAVQRNAKMLSSAPFAAKYAARVVNISKEAEAIWFDNVTGEYGDESLYLDGMKGMHNALAAEKADLDNISAAMLKSFLKSYQILDDYKVGEKVHFTSWLRDQLTTAATDAIYGPMNPFKVQEVRNGFWDFYDNFTMLLINAMPSITAPSGYKGREKVFKAVERYMRDGGPENNSSGLLRALVNASRKYNVSAKDAAHFEVLNVQAALANIIPVTFWNLYHIYSDPGLLQAIRTEVQKSLTVVDDVSGVLSYNLDVSKLRTVSPLMQSVFYEVLRVRSSNASVRMTLKDTVIQDRYLFKKNAVIHMPSHVIHNDTSIWGPNARKFQADRFKASQKMQPGTFRAFGGGTTLCPGRHFATTTVISIVSMFVLRYDLQPAMGSWTEPTQNINHLVASVLPPDQDILMSVVPRNAVDGSWNFVNVGLKSQSSFSAME